MAAVSSLVFLLLIALPGGPLQPVGKYSSLEACQAAVTQSAMTDAKTSKETLTWGPARVTALCVPLEENAAQ